MVYIKVGRYFVHCFEQDYALGNQATWYASQHYSVPVSSKNILGGLWQEGYSA